MMDEIDIQTLVLFYADKKSPFKGAFLFPS